MTQFIRTASAWILMIALIVVVIAANSVYTIHTLNELAAVEGRIFTTNKIIDSINALHVAVLRT
ncbi:histidine kinase, partial [Alteromonas sp. LMIT007]|nr:histidine kinase [Opacimonas viscosa]